MTDRKNILIVDDDEDVKELYELAFADSEFELTYITSSLDAIRHLDKTPNPADVILLDLAMSRMDGLTLAEQIRINEIKNHNRAARLAFFTSYDAAVVPTYGADRHYGFGVEGVIQKPIAPDELLEVLRKWLSKKPENGRAKAKVFQPQNGATSPAMLVGLGLTVVLIITVTIFMVVLHAQEEKSAYEYLKLNRNFKRIEQICVENWKTSATLIEWNRQTGNAPPPNLLVLQNCLVAKENE